MSPGRGNIRTRLHMGTQELLKTTKSLGDDDEGCTKIKVICASDLATRIISTKEQCS